MRITVNPVRMLQKSAERIVALIKSGATDEIIHTTLDICGAKVHERIESAHFLWPGTRMNAFQPNDYLGVAARRFDTFPDMMSIGGQSCKFPDVSYLFTGSFLSGYTPEDLMRQQLLPMLFATMPFMKRVEVCAIKLRKYKAYQKILLSWLIAFMFYDCRSAEPDQYRDRLIRVARYDAVRCMLGFVGRVMKTCETAADLIPCYEEYVRAQESNAACGERVTVERVSRNIDWARAGAMDEMIPGNGHGSVAVVLKKLSLKGYKCFVDMIREDAWVDDVFPLDQLLLFLCANASEWETKTTDKMAHCIAAIVDKNPALLGVKDANGDGLIWQLIYDRGWANGGGTSSVAKVLKRYGCDSSAESSICVSYDDVMNCMSALQNGQRGFH